MSGLATILPPTDGLSVLTLNRPSKSNAISAELVEDFHASLDEIGTDTRVLLIRGEGRNFSAGFDLGEVGNQSAGDLLLRFVRINELLCRLRSASYLTVARVQGAAYGAGADIVCACAVRIGVGAVRFRFPGFRFGVALGTRRLGVIVGLERARSILMHNEELDAQAALECGLLTETVPVWDDKRCADLAQTASALDPEALGTLTRLTDSDRHSDDLADLVRSVARPGLHVRLSAYLANSQKQVTRAASAGQ